MPLSANKINIYGKPKTQVVKKRFLGFIRKAEHKLLTPETIHRKTRGGLEQFDFYEGSSKVRKYHVEYLVKNKKQRKATTVEFFLNGGKKVIKERFNFKIGKTKIEKETITRNCIQNRKLVSEVNEISGIDDFGKFTKTITKTINPETHKPTSVQNEKRYNNKDGIPASENFKKITTLFDEKGNKNYQKIETPSGWTSSEFDEKKNPFNQDSGSYEKYTENLI